MRANRSLANCARPQSSFPRTWTVSRSSCALNLSSRGCEGQFVGLARSEPTPMVPLPFVLRRAAIRTGRRAYKQLAPDRRAEFRTFARFGTGIMRLSPPDRPLARVRSYMLGFVSHAFPELEKSSTVPCRSWQRVWAVGLVAHRYSVEESLPGWVRRT